MAEHPNVEKVRRAYEAFATGDMQVGESMSDDIVWHAGGNNPLSGDYKGKEEVFSWLMRLAQETGGTFKVDVHDILANDEHAVGLVRVSAERNGKRLDQNSVHVYHVNAEGQATELWGFFDDQAAADDFWS